MQESTHSFVPVWPASGGGEASSAPNHVRASPPRPSGREQLATARNHHPPSIVRHSLLPNVRNHQRSRTPQAPSQLRHLPSTDANVFRIETRAQPRQRNDRPQRLPHVGSQTERRTAGGQEAHGCLPRRVSVLPWFGLVKVHTKSIELERIEGSVEVEDGHGKG